MEKIKLCNLRMNVIRLVISPKATRAVLLAMRKAYEETKKRS